MLCPECGIVAAPGPLRECRDDAIFAEGDVAAQKPSCDPRLREAASFARFLGWCMSSLFAPSRF